MARCLIERHADTELLIELLQGALTEEGYEVKRYSDGNTKRTSEYDCLVIKDRNDNYYNLCVTENIWHEGCYGRKDYDPKEDFERVDKIN